MYSDSSLLEDGVRRRHATRVRNRRRTGRGDGILADVLHGYDGRLALDDIVREEQAVAMQKLDALATAAATPYTITPSQAHAVPAPHLDPYAAVAAAPSPVRADRERDRDVLALQRHLALLRCNVDEADDRKALLVDETRAFAGLVLGHVPGVTSCVASAERRRAEAKVAQVVAQCDQDRARWVDEAVKSKREFSNTLLTRDKAEREHLARITAGERDSYMEWRCAAEKRWREQLQRLEQELASTQKSTNVSDAAAKMQAANMRASMEELSAMQQRWQSEIAMLTSELTLSKQRVASLTDECDKLRAHHHKVERGASTHLTQALDDATSEAAALRRERDALRQQLREAESQKQEAEARHTAMARRVDFVEGERDTAEKEAKSLQIDVRTLRDAQRATQRTCDEKIAESRKLHDVITALRTELAAAGESRNRLAREQEDALHALRQSHSAEVHALTLKLEQGAARLDAAAQHHRAEVEQQQARCAQREDALRADLAREVQRHKDTVAAHGAWQQQQQAQAQAQAALVLQHTAAKPDSPPVSRPTAVAKGCPSVEARGGAPPAPDTQTTLATTATAATTTATQQRGHTSHTDGGTPASPPATAANTSRPPLFVSAGGAGAEAGMDVDAAVAPTPAPSTHDVAPAKQLDFSPATLATQKSVLRGSGTGTRASGTAAAKPPQQRQARDEPAAVAELSIDAVEVCLGGDNVVSPSTALLMSENTVPQNSFARVPAAAPPAAQAKAVPALAPAAQEAPAAVEPPVVATPKKGGFLMSLKAKFSGGGKPSAKKEKEKQDKKETKEKKEKVSADRERESSKAEDVPTPGTLAQDTPEPELPPTATASAPTMSAKGAAKQKQRDAKEQRLRKGVADKEVKERKALSKLLEKKTKALLAKNKFLPPPPGQISLPTLEKPARIDVQAPTRAANNTPDREKAATPTGGSPVYDVGSVGIDSVMAHAGDGVGVGGNDDSLAIYPPGDNGSCGTGACYRRSFSSIDTLSVDNALLAPDGGISPCASSQWTQPPAADAVSLAGRGSPDTGGKAAPGATPRAKSPHSDALTFDTSTSGSSSSSSASSSPVAVRGKATTAAAGGLVKTTAPQASAVREMLRNKPDAPPPPPPAAAAAPTASTVAKHEFDDSSDDE